MSRIPARKTNGNRRSTGLAGVGLLIAGNLGCAAAQPYRYLAGRGCRSAPAFFIRSRPLHLDFVSPRLWELGCSWREFGAARRRGPTGIWQGGAAAPPMLF